MSDFVADRRKQLPEDALEALGVIVRAIQSNLGTGQVGKLVRFIAGCYNSHDYPFELDLLRARHTQLVASCLTYLAYDSLGENEIHHYRPGGDKSLHAGSGVRTRAGRTAAKGSGAGGARRSQR